MRHATHSHARPGFAWLTLVAAIIAVLILGGAGVTTYHLMSHDETVHAEAGDPNQWYICGMHPWIIEPEPGLCPICHMELVPLDPARFTGEIAIDPVMVQNIGVRLAEAKRGELEQRIRTVGTVQYDETRLRDVNTKVAGWIETLHVDSVGAQVQAGDPLFELYSPELFAAQEEYLLAHRGLEKARAQGSAAAIEQAQQLLDAAKTRLDFFDISAEQVKAIIERGEPTRTLTVRSPHTGVVIDRGAYQGMRVEPGTRLYRIADLSYVWVQATVFESQLPQVAQGQSATLTLSYLPGRMFEGEVAYVYPYLNEQTREARLRLAFANADGLLKPGMYAEVVLHDLASEPATLVPREAVIDTGERQVLFVSLGEGRFEPRNVQTGRTGADGWVEVLEGVQPGEPVVTSGQFLLDSESRTREALAKMMSDNLAQPPASEGHQHSGMRLETVPDSVVPADYPLEVCPVTGLKLGSMGEPLVRKWGEQVVQFCCPACPPRFEKNPQTYLDKLTQMEPAP